MIVVKEDTSYRTKPKKKYSRAIFHCKNDDVWINLEAPLE
jgi:hypothetical protein